MRLLAFLLACLLTCRPVAGFGQAVAPAYPGVPGRVASGLAATGAVRACIRHPLLCGAAAAAGGLAVANSAAKSRQAQAGRPCPGPAVSIFRVVESAEHLQIKALRRYALLPTQMQQKQFWLDAADADWFAGAMSRPSGVILPGGRFLVTSRVCQVTLERGFSFSDVGHRAVSFGSDTLPLVNRDAAASGGVTTLKEYR